MDAELADVIRKQTVVLTKLTKAIEQVLKKIEEMPLNLDVGSEAPQDAGQPLPIGQKPIPDRHDRANLEHAERQLRSPAGALSNEDRTYYEETVRNLHAKFDWSAKRRPDGAR